MNKSYYAIIPANVRYDQDLTPNAKLLYGEITALCNERGYCWATNEYFAELYNVHNKSISRLISALEKKGYIKSELVYEGKQIKNRHIYITPSNNNVDTYEQNCDYPSNKIVTTPMDKIVTDNNTSFNTTFNNTNNIYIPYVEIINYLNEKAGTNYRASGKKTKDLIKARFNEKFTLDDFKQVIDIKVNEWGKDKNMNKFLRPETLFGTKFEGYLNQKDLTIKKSDYEAINGELLF